MTECRLRTEDGEEILSLDELEARLRAGEVPPRGWISVQGLTQGFVRLRDSPLASRADALRRCRFRMSFALDRLPLGALALAVACVLLHGVAERVAGGAPDRDVLLWLGARARPAVLVDGEVWRLWTGAFLHRDRWHLGFNLLVMVAVGGALESIYSRLGWLAVVAWGALVSSSVSLWLGPPITVGLSGVVFAMLGASVGFGVRFRDVLPKSHQRWFGAVSLGYALFALWSGARTPEVDHSGHLGGLLAGLALGLLLPPRRWEESAWLRHADRSALVAGVGASVLAAAGLWWQSQQPVVLLPQKASHPGVVLHIPRGFSATRDAFGLTAYDNGLDAQVSLGCARAPAAWPRWASPAGPAETVAERELAVNARMRDIDDFTWHSPQWTLVGEDGAGGSWPAQELAVRFHLDGQPVDARLLVFERGLTHCALMLATRAQASRKRQGMLDRVRATVEWAPPLALVHAREALQREPASAQARLEAGLAALAVGEVSEARTDLEGASSVAPMAGLVWIRAHYALGQLFLLVGEPRAALGHARLSRAAAPHDVDVGLLLLGTLRHLGRGGTPEAQALTEQLAPLHPEVSER